MAPQNYGQRGAPISALSPFRHAPSIRRDQTHNTRIPLKKKSFPQHTTRPAPNSTPVASSYPFAAAPTAGSHTPAAGRRRSPAVAAAVGSSRAAAPPPWWGSRAAARPRHSHHVAAAAGSPAAGSHPAAAGSRPGGGVPAGRRRVRARAAGGRPGCRWGRWVVCALLLHGGKNGDGKEE